MSSLFFFFFKDGVSDIYISGLFDRNRALNGDEVAVLLYPREQWKVGERFFKLIEAEWCIYASAK